MTQCCQVNDCYRGKRNCACDKLLKNRGPNCNNTVLETAGRIVAKCDQTLVWATKFFPKDRPENEFGRPNLGRGYRMFSAYLRSISKINIFKTDQRTWGNNIVFLPKEAAIILTGSLRFSATCCLILFSKKNIFENPTYFIEEYPNVPRWNERNEMSRAFDFIIKDRRDSDRSINHPIKWVSDWVSEWMGGCGWVSEWMWLIDPMSEWMSAWEWVDVGWWESGCDWLSEWVSEWMGGCGWVS